MNGVVKEYVTPTRLYDYETVCGAVGGTYPEYYRLPDEYTGTLKDQGSTQACVACVIAEIAEAIHNQTMQEDTEMSEGYAYGSLRDAESDHCGMATGKAIDYWRKLGTVPKSYFDVLQEMPEMRDMVEKVPELAEIASRYKIGGYASIGYADKARRDLAIKKAITEQGHGVVAVSNSAFGSPHCIQLVGWDDARNKYLFKNSWGPAYGDNGFSAIDKNSINAAYAILPQEVTLPFEDVPESHWAHKYIKNMYFNGITNGTGKTTFEPDKPLTRAEAAAILYRILKATDERFEVLNEVLNEKLK